MRFKDFLSLFVSEVLGINGFKCVSKVQLGKLFGHSVLTTLFKLLHASLHRVLDHDNVSHKGIRRIDVGFRMDEVSRNAGSTCIFLATKCWNEAFRFGTISLRTIVRSRRSLIKHFGFDWFRRLRLIGFEILLRVLERNDVIQIVILDSGFMIDVIRMDRLISVLLFRESVVLVHGRII